MTHVITLPFYFCEIANLNNYNSMTRSKKLYLTLFSMVLVFFLMMFWYRSTFSMEKKKGYYINKNSTETILIATQGSEFKDSLVNSLVDYYDKDTINIKVIDVSELDQISSNDYAAILIIHTWEMWKAPDVIVDFISSNEDLSRIIAFATSGDGNNKIMNIDGIAGASAKNKIPSYLKEITAKMNLILSQQK